MGRFELSNTGDWKLENSEHDIRGWSVRDAEGNTLGTVVKLIANTDTEQVESNMLDNGDEYPTRDIELHDGIVYVEGVADEMRAETGPVVKTYDNTRVLRNET